jgi:hypothetical protein
VQRLYQSVLLDSFEMIALELFETLPICASYMAPNIVSRSYLHSLKGYIYSKAKMRHLQS